MAVMTSRQCGYRVFRQPWGRYGPFLNQTKGQKSMLPGKNTKIENRHLPGNATNTVFICSMSTKFAVWVWVSIVEVHAKFDIDKSMFKKVWLMNRRHKFKMRLWLLYRFVSRKICCGGSFQVTQTACKKCYYRNEKKCLKKLFQ